MRGSDAGWSERSCTDAERRVLLGVARAAVLAAARAIPSPPLPDDLPARLAEPAGAFVSLRDARGRLRGCIGGVAPDGPLAAVVARVATAAATRDPRFPRLHPEELAGLRVEVSVLSPIRRVTPAEIEPTIHGLCLEHGRRRAILLPQVAAGEGWDTETLLGHLCEKAEVAPDAWRDPAARLFAFTVEIVEGAV